MDVIYREIFLMRKQLSLRKRVAFKCDGILEITILCIEKNISCIKNILLRKDSNVM